MELSYWVIDPVWKPTSKMAIMNLSLGVHALLYSLCKWNPGWPLRPIGCGESDSV